MPFRIQRNMNGYDRALRTLAGSSLLLLGPIGQVITIDTFSNIILGILGAIALLSAVFSYCFLYEVTGFNTITKSDSQE